MTKYHHIVVREAPTPEARMTNLLAFFGWQGGTIHQLEQATGVNAETLLYAPDMCQAINDHYSLGAAALETCSKAWRVDMLAPARQGDEEFWIGVAHALRVCGEDK